MNAFFNKISFIFVGISTYLILFLIMSYPHYELMTWHGFFGGMWIVPIFIAVAFIWRELHLNEVKYLVQDAVKRTSLH